MAAMEQERRQKQEQEQEKVSLALHLRLPPRLARAARSILLPEMAQAQGTVRPVLKGGLTA